MKNRNTMFTIILLACFGPLPAARAVVPPPDGGYPGFNTAEGTKALQNLTTGAGNTAAGWYSLFTNSDAGFNTAVGAGTLVLSNGNSNTAVGAAALLLNSDGHSNIAVGVSALQNNQTGFRNTAVGTHALPVNTASFNTAIGDSALFSNTTGNLNTATGISALFENISGTLNTAVGESALVSNTTGSGNTAIGDSAGANLTTGSGNVCVGVEVFGVAGESDTTRIRNLGSTAIVGGTNVVVDGIGGTGDQRLGYASSSRRYKADIKAMDKASETLFALKPVTFRAKGKMNPSTLKHYGLIAEDVAAVAPDLVVYNPEGKPETLRFNSINAMLLNEFLKEHRKNREQEATIAELKVMIAKQGAIVAHQQEQIEALNAGLQKMSDQTQMSKAAANLARNNQ
jgi:uncharacterized coiled-coil protein SlyX